MYLCSIFCDFVISSTVRCWKFFKLFGKCRKYWKCWKCFKYVENVAKKAANLLTGPFFRGKLYFGKEFFLYTYTYNGRCLTLNKWCLFQNFNAWIGTKRIFLTSTLFSISTTKFESFLFKNEDNQIDKICFSLSATSPIVKSYIEGNRRKLNDGDHKKSVARKNIMWYQRNDTKLCYCSQFPQCFRAPCKSTTNKRKCNPNVRLFVLPKEIEGEKFSNRKTVVVFMRDYKRIIQEERRTLLNLIQLFG